MEAVVLIIFLVLAGFGLVYAVALVKKGVAQLIKKIKEKKEKKGE
jgi:hypothetical protein